MEAATQVAPARVRASDPLGVRFAVWVSGLTITACMLAVGLLILLPGLGRILDHPTVVVSTGSMTPGLRPGDAIVLEPVFPGAIEVADVITYRTPSDAGLVTHRVVGIRHIEGELWFQTRGDANSQPDPDLTAADDVQGRVRWTARGVGHLLAAASSRWGAVILLGIPAALLLLQEARALTRSRRRSGTGAR